MSAVPAAAAPSPHVPVAHVEPLPAKVVMMAAWLFEAMRRMIDPSLRARMSKAAREFAEANDVREPYSAILDSRGYRRRRKSEKLLAELLFHADEADSASDEG